MQLTRNSFDGWFFRTLCSDTFLEVEVWRELFQEFRRRLETTGSRILSLWLDDFSRIFLASVLGLPSCPGQITIFDHVLQKDIFKTINKQLFRSHNEICYKRWRSNAYPLHWILITNFCYVTSLEEHIYSNCCNIFINYRYLNLYDETT